MSSSNARTMSSQRQSRPVPPRNWPGARLDNKVALPTVAGSVPMIGTTGHLITSPGGGAAGSGAVIERPTSGVNWQSRSRPLADVRTERIGATKLTIVNLPKDNRANAVTHLPTLKKVPAVNLAPCTRPADSTQTGRRAISRSAVLELPGAASCGKARRLRTRSKRPHPWCCLQVARQVVAGFRGSPREQIAPVRGPGPRSNVRPPR